MRLFTDITKLIPIISNNSLSDIERQLRIIAITQGSADDRKLFALAHAFKSTHPELPVNWRDPIVHYGLLADWFNQASTIEDHEKNAMGCWYLAIAETISEEIQANEMIKLGLAYLSDPYKFTAFLVWLIENDVHPKEIINHGLLQKYFSYTIFSIDTLHKTYALLKNVSDKVDIFLQHARHVSCALNGFINLELEDKWYRSYNVLGDFFDHEMFKAAWTSTPVIYLPVLSANHGGKFFDLFDWTFITALDLEVFHHKLLFLNILQQGARDKLLSEFSQRSLIGELNEASVNALLKCIANYYYAETLIELIQKEPFYIHTFMYKLPVVMYFTDVIDTACEQLSTNDYYKTLAHIPLLVRLVQKSVIATTDVIREKLLRMIVDIIVKYTNGFPDDVLDALHPIKFLLKPHCEKKIGDLYNTLLFYTDYDTLETQWSAQLPLVELIKYLYPEFSKTLDYPYSKWDLKIFYVTQMKDLQLTAVLSEICTPETEKRSLQEMIFKINNFQIIMQLIAYIADRYAAVEFYQQPTLGSEKVNLLQALIKAEKYDTLKMVVNHIQIEESAMVCVLKSALMDQNNALLKALSPSIKLFNAAMKAALEEGKQNSNRPMIKYLCGLSDFPFGDYPGIIKNNLALYIKIVKEKTSLNFIEFWQTECWLNAIKITEKPRLTLLIHSNNYLLIRDTFALMESTFDRKVFVMILSRTPSLYGRNTPVKRQINTFIDNKKAEYGLQENSHKKRPRSPALFDLPRDFETQRENSTLMERQRSLTSTLPLTQSEDDDSTRDGTQSIRRESSVETEDLLPPTLYRAMHAEDEFNGMAY